jgi:hypothetical protein
MAWKNPVQIDQKILKRIIPSICQSIPDELSNKSLLLEGLPGVGKALLIDSNC